MGDAELDAIRRARMQELQSESGGGQEGKEKEDQKYEMPSLYQHTIAYNIVQEARSRCTLVDSFTDSRTRSSG